MPPLYQDYKITIGLIESHYEDIRNTIICSLFSAMSGACDVGLGLIFDSYSSMRRDLSTC